MTQRRAERVYMVVQDLGWGLWRPEALVESELSASTLVALAMLNLGTTRYSYFSMDVVREESSEG